MRLDDREEFVQEEFDRQAKRWVLRPLSQEDLVMLEQIAQAAQLNCQERVLDVACGVGLASFSLAAHAREVVGVDISGGMLAQARAIRHKRGVRNVRFILGAAEHLPFADESFDAVVCRLAIHHFPQPEIEMREMARVLKPHGRLVIVDAVSSEDAAEAELHNAIERLRDPSHARMLARSELLGLIERCGLKVLEAPEWARARDYDEWMDVINEPTRTENLKVILAALAEAGAPAGLALRLEKGRLRLTHRWVLARAVK